MICALTHLSLPVEHETASKNVDLIHKIYCCVTLSSLNSFCAVVSHSIPVDAVSNDFTLDYIFACVKVESTYHVQSVTASGKSRTFSRCRHPFGIYHISYINSEALSLLHPLDVILETPDKFISELVLWYIVSWTCCESLIIILLACFIILVEVFWFWSFNIYPMFDNTFFKNLRYLALN